MTAEEAIAAIVQEMNDQAALEEHMHSTKEEGYQVLFARGKSYIHIAATVAQVTGKPTGLKPFRY